MNIALRIVAYCAVVVVTFVFYVRFMERTTVFHPDKMVAYTPKDAGLAYEDVYFDTSDRVLLNGWMVNSHPAGGTVLFLHGNAGNIGNRLDKTLIFDRMGLNVFLIDYRGFGKSRGHATESGMYKDALAAYEELLRRKVPPEKIVLYGESLGGAAAVDLASRQPVGAVILDSTFSSGADMAKVILPIVPSAILSVKLDSIGKISKVRVPKLFMHSPQDEVIPYRLGKKLFDAAPEPKTFVEIQGTHNDGYWAERDTFVNGIASFLGPLGLRAR